MSKPVARLLQKSEAEQRLEEALALVSQSGYKVSPVATVPERPYAVMPVRKVVEVMMHAGPTWSISMGG